MDTSPRRAEGEHPVAGGSWVEIEQVVLPAGERAPNVPEDTASVDFVARIRGFLQSAAPIGAEVSVTTLTGRSVTGRLRAVNPRNPADFGNPIAELLVVGAAARRSLEGESQGRR